MGRQTVILYTSIYDDEEGETVTKPSDRFKRKMMEKYRLDEYNWCFNKEGDIEYKNNTSINSDKTVYGEVEDHVKMLLETAKHYNRKISGNLMYHDDQTGGSFCGIIYIAKNYTALCHEFNTDTNIETLGELGNIQSIKTIHLD